MPYFVYFVYIFNKNKNKYSLIFTTNSKEPGIYLPLGQ